MSRKGEAKKRKAERLRNKKLIERYPWIWPVDWHWKRIQSYNFTMYDDVPTGWKLLNECFILKKNKPKGKILFIDNIFRYIRSRFDETFGEKGGKQFVKFNQRLKDKEFLWCYTVIVPHKSM